MGRVEIKVKGQTLVCENYTLEHAMFFGTLLMSAEELHVYIKQEDPDRAFKMMSDRLAQFVETLKQKLEGSQDLNRLIDEEVIQLFAKRMLVRIGQNQVPDQLIPDIRYEVAKRLVEVFPLVNRAWVSQTAINLEPDELISMVAMPLFYHMAQSDQTQKEEVAIAPQPEPQPAPAETVAEAIIAQDLPETTAGKGFAPTPKPPIQTPLPVEVAAEITPEPAVEEAAIAPVVIPPEVQEFLDRNPEYLVRRKQESVV